VIWEIHLVKHNQQASEFSIPTLAQATDRFTGAEIEQTLVDAMFNCFSCSENLTQKQLIHAAAETTPLVTTMAEQMNALRKWAKDRACPASHSLEVSDGRKLSLVGGM